MLGAMAASREKGQHRRMRGVNGVLTEDPSMAETAPDKEKI
jgi:hypothetical protein